MPLVARRVVLAVLVTAFALPGQAVPVRSKADAYVAAGKAALETGAFDRAIDYFEKALKQDPANTEAKSRLEATVRALGQAHAKADALTSAGQAALSAEAFEQASNYFEKALEEWPESPLARGGLQKAIEQRQASAKMKLELEEITGLITGLAWPFVVLAVLVIFRRQMKRFLEGVGALAGRGLIKGISLPGVLTLEFFDLKEAKIPWSGPEYPDVRGMGSTLELTSSGIMVLLDRIQAPGRADYAVFDLGSGDQWLTSRLYIFAFMLRRMHGLRYCVFVEGTQNTRRRFVGVAEANAVRWALARRYPYLEHSLIKAFAASQTEIHYTSNTGAVSSPDAGMRVVDFLRSIQQPQAPSQAPLTDEWVKLRDGITWERAQWLSAGSLERLLGDDLRRSHVRTIDLQTRPQKEQVALVLRVEEDVVAVVDETGRFERLIDRLQLADKAIRQTELAG